MIRVWKSIKWQLQVVFYEIRTAAAFFIILNGLTMEGFFSSPLFPPAVSSIKKRDYSSCSSVSVTQLPCFWDCFTG